MYVLSCRSSQLVTHYRIFKREAVELQYSAVLGSAWQCNGCVSQTCYKDSYSCTIAVVLDRLAAAL